MQGFPVVPTLIEFQTQYTALEGSSVSLCCLASGSPDPIIVWEKDWKVLIPTLKDHRLGHKAVLILNNITVSDAGIYRCTARNIYGSDSRKAKLSILPHSIIVISPSVTFPPVDLIPSYYYYCILVFVVLCMSFIICVVLITILCYVCRKYLCNNKFIL